MVVIVPKNRIGRLIRAEDGPRRWRQSAGLGVSPGHSHSCAIRTIAIRGKELKAAQRSALRIINYNFGEVVEVDTAIDLDGLNAIVVGQNELAIGGVGDRLCEVQIS
jgi:hypothetical protein